MVKLEDLLLTRFRVEKVDGLMKAIEDAHGNYRAGNAKEVEEALTQEGHTNMDVLIGKTWYEIRGNYRGTGKLGHHSEEYWKGYRAGHNKK